MKSLLLEAPGSLAWADVPEPAPSSGEVLVRVHRCSVCGTDLHAFAGNQPFFSYPRRLGHELCVEVISPGGSDLRSGQLCAVEPYYSCGSCPACRSGKTNCCRHLKVLGVHIDGGFAPRITVPAGKLHPAGSLLPDQIALVEPLVIGAHGIERAAPKAGEPMVILGLGPIGITAAMIAKAAGADIACVDVRRERREFACDRLGLGKGFCPGSDLCRELQEHFGQLPSVVVDATGNPDSMQSTFQLAEHGGRVVFIGLFTGDVTFDDTNFHRRELTLMASRAGLSQDFRNVIALMQTGALNVESMITHRFGFSETAERLPALHLEAGLIKAIIAFD